MSFHRDWLDHAEGSVLVEFGKTRVLCAVSFTPGVPRWKAGAGEGWLTAEYAMLPRSTHTRSDRESIKGRVGGRTHEISRLIGRSLRAVLDMKSLGENTIVIDCDVLQADGGTRTAAITGAFVAVHAAAADRSGRIDRLMLLAPAFDFGGNRLRQLGEHGIELRQRCGIHGPRSATTGAWSEGRSRRRGVRSMVQLLQQAIG